MKKKLLANIGHNLKPQIKKDLRLQGLKGVLVTSQVNIRYLTGFHACDAWLLITANQWYYITDKRYTVEAEKGVANAIVVEIETSFFITLEKLLKRHRVDVVGYEEQDLSCFQFRQLRTHNPMVRKWQPLPYFVEVYRRVKTAYELSMIHEGLRLHQKALNYLKRIMKAGMTERDVYIKLDAFVKKLGVDFSFSPIIASGPHSSYPHAQITDRVIGASDMVLVDMGIDYMGYKTDLTRVFFLGKIPQTIEDVYDTVHKSQLEAIQRIRPGVLVAEADQAARQYLANHNLAQYFGHALGHGVGLDVHEVPRLSQKSDEAFEEGMIVTVEPGVYFPHRFGIRLEEMVLVTQKGSVVISDDIY